jgi:hypothetical protein
MLAIISLVITAPVHAWKPRTHLFFAEEALKDALDDGKVTLYEVDYRSGRVLGTLGSFAVDERILFALRQCPKQYRAGVLGPDAYPDIVTGQQVVHPHASHALTGDAAGGSNAWLTHLYNQAFVSRPWDKLPPHLAKLVPRYDTPAIQAFVIGYITHAAGDMYAHTFVNNFSGGEFMLTPDPRNALKHILLEGYIGKRTPIIWDGAAGGVIDPNWKGGSFAQLAQSEAARNGVTVDEMARRLDTRLVTESDVSIDGVTDFLYSEMTWAKPNSILEKRLLVGEGAGKSIPAIFSALRNELKKDVDRYDDLLKGKTKLKPSDTLWLQVEGPKIGFKRRWIEDIDKGLKQWPKFSHEIGQALLFNERGGGADVSRAKALASAYIKDYLAYMGPIPDFVVDGVKLMSEIIDALTPSFPFLKELLAELKRDAINYLMRSATGRSLDEWADFVKNPERHFDPILNAAGGEHPGRTARRITLAQFNRDHLKIADTGFASGETFRIEDFPPGFNTVQMSKMILLGETGMKDLLAVLEKRGLPKPKLPGGGFRNVMLGFLQSLDNDNQWQGIASKGANPSATLVFAQDGGATYQRLFMRVVGEEEWATPHAANNNTGTNPDGTPAGPTPAQIALMDRLAGEWQNRTAGPGGAIRMTFTREGNILKGTTLVKGQYTDNLHPGAVTEIRASSDGTALEGEWWTPSDVAGYIPRRGTLRITLATDGETFQGAYRQPDYGGDMLDRAYDWNAIRYRPTGADTANNSSDASPRPGATDSGNGGGGTIPVPAGTLGSYRVGKQSPMQVSIRSLAYTVERVAVGEEIIAPKAGEKLLVIRFSAANAGAEVVTLESTSLRFLVTTADGQTHENRSDIVGVEQSKREVSTPLDPAASLDLYTVVVLPADAESVKLVVQRTTSGDEQPRGTLSLSGKITPLQAPFAEGANGSAARAKIAGRTGEIYPLGAFDIRLDEIRREEGRLEAIVTLKNRTPKAITFHNALLKALLTDGEGQVIPWNDTLYRVGKTGTLDSVLIEADAEMRVRLRWTFSKGLEPTTLSLAEFYDGDVTRAYTFSVPPAAPAATNTAP